jgi:glutamyl-Q tRNA(Asp) synthetase
MSVFRFAPSPNGRLHLGHAYSALLNAELARRFGGVLLLRLEDIDTARCKAEFEAGILDDLAWLGLHWEKPVRRQSEHLPDYAAALAILRAQKLVFPCFCSRGDIARAVAEREVAEPEAPWPRDPEGAPLYPGRCRHLSPSEAERRIGAGEPHGWRLAMDRARAASGSLTYACFDPDGGRDRKEARPELWGDAVVVRKELATSYHLSDVTDDALQNVTHVVRGLDLLAATGLHTLLQHLLGLTPPAYHHHRLILDEAGRKLAKSAGSPSLLDLRRHGASSAGIRRRLGFV